MKSFAYIVINSLHALRLRLSSPPTTMLHTAHIHLLHSTVIQILAISIGVVNTLFKVHSLRSLADFRSIIGERNLIDSSICEWRLKKYIVIHPSCYGERNDRTKVNVRFCGRQLAEQLEAGDRCRLINTCCHQDAFYDNISNATPWSMEGQIDNSKVLV